MFDKLPYGLEFYIYTLVPDWIIIGLPVVTLVFAWVLWKYKWCVLLIGYYLLLLCQTLIFRYVNDSYDYRILPLQKVTDIMKCNPDLCWETGLNLVVFVPIGILLTLWLGASRWKQVIGIGAGLSLLIELLQLITRRGLCETDDVIVNAIGCAIGVGVVKGFKFLVSGKVSEFLCFWGYGGLQTRNKKQGTRNKKEHIGTRDIESRNKQAL